MTHSFPSRRASELVGEARRAIAGGRRRGGVDQRDLLLRAVVPEYLGQAKVVGEQRVAVALRGGRDGAEVEDGGEPPFGPAQELRQLLRRDHVLDLVVGEVARSEEHTSELQSLMRISYAVFCLKKKKSSTVHNTNNTIHGYQSCAQSKSGTQHLESPLQ